MFSSRLSAPVFMAGLLALVAPARAFDVLSYHNDPQSTGQNLSETRLTPQSVNPDAFKKRFSTAVDGQVYAQPLFMAGVEITGANAGTHDVVFVTTEHNSLYAIDVITGGVLWKRVLDSGVTGATKVSSVPSTEVNTDDLKPEIGVTGTPVIDPAAQAIFVSSKSKQIVHGVTASPHYVHTLYKISVQNGAILAANFYADTIADNNGYTYRTADDPAAAQDPFVFGTGDGAITVNSQSRVYFNALRQMNRPGLVLHDGKICIAFASHGDNGPYHGWLLSFDAGTLALSGVLNLTPNGGLGGVWQAGGIPALDANGDFFFETGNGTFDGGDDGQGNTAGLDANGFPVNGNYGDCFVRVSLDGTSTPANQNKNGWGLKVADYFAPFNNHALDSADTDLGSGGLVILPDSVGSTSHPHLLLGSGKEGKIYLLDRANLGKFDPATDHVVQTQGSAINGSLDTPAYFNGRIYYVGGYGDNGKSFTIANGAFSAAPDHQTPDGFDFPGSTPSISANGTNNGLVWTLDRGSGQLRAYSANDLGTQVWTSAQALGGSDALGSVVKFTVPTVADGRVFVGTSNALVCYGPPAPPTGPPAAPSLLAGGTVSGLEVALLWKDNAKNEDGFKIERSTDGVSFMEVGEVGVNTENFTAGGLQVATLYYFRVRAFNSFNGQSFSPYSATISVPTTAQPPTLDYSGGFQDTEPGLTFVGAARVANGRAALTDGGGGEAGALWSKTAQDIRRFVCNFTFQVTPADAADADGFTFCLQRAGGEALGASGGSLGYEGVKPSVALKFDLYPALSATGFYSGGIAPGEDARAVEMSAQQIDLHSGHVFAVSLVYLKNVLTQTVTDTQTGAEFTHLYKVNIPLLLRGYTAFVGFTGGTGGQTATQEILTWSYAPIPAAAPLVPTKLLAAPASGTQINLAWTDRSPNEAGFRIERRAGTRGLFKEIGVTPVNVAAFMDTALLPATTYYYRVRATNRAGNSGYTPIAHALTPVPPPTPTEAHTTLLAPTEIDLQWKDNAKTETGYRVLRKASAASTFFVIAPNLPPNTTSYHDTTVVAGTTYDYHIQGFNLAGYSDFTGLTATTPAAAQPFAPTLVAPLPSAARPEAPAAFSAAVQRRAPRVSSPAAVETIRGRSATLVLEVAPDLATFVFPPDEILALESLDGEAHLTLIYRRAVASPLEYRVEVAEAGAPELWSEAKPETGFPLLLGDGSELVKARDPLPSSFVAPRRIRLRVSPPR